MRITMKCHTKGCKEPINEGMARLVGDYWYYCIGCVDKRILEEEI